jgi:8-oxo-dGTP pyrophosphatase MutT (NUDIX family)
MNSTFIQDRADDIARNVGKEPDAAARRECHEEIGKVPETVVRLAAFLPTPGYCTEEMVFFRLSGLMIPDQPADPIEAPVQSIRGLTGVYSNLFALFDHLILDPKESSGVLFRVACHVGRRFAARSSQRHAQHRP